LARIGKEGKKFIPFGAKRKMDSPKNKVKTLVVSLTVYSPVRWKGSRLALDINWMPVIRGGRSKKRKRYVRVYLHGAPRSSHLAVATEGKKVLGGGEKGSGFPLCKGA